MSLHSLIMNHQESQRSVVKVLQQLQTQEFYPLGILMGGTVLDVWKENRGADKKRKASEGINNMLWATAINMGPMDLSLTFSTKYILLSDARAHLAENPGQVPAPMQTQNSSHLMPCKEGTQRWKMRICGQVSEAVCSWVGWGGETECGIPCCEPEKAPKLGKQMATRKKGMNRWWHCHPPTHRPPYTLCGKLTVLREGGLETDLCNIQNLCS